MEYVIFKRKVGRDENFYNKQRVNGFQIHLKDAF